MLWLFYFLFQVIKDFVIKECANGYLESVAQFFYGVHPWVDRNMVDYIADCRLCYAGYSAYLVYGYISFAAKRLNSLHDCFGYGHLLSPIIGIPIKG